MGDGSRPHQFPRSADGTYPDYEVLAWKCSACGEWINEFGPIDRSECSVDWRNHR